MNISLQLPFSGATLERMTTWLKILLLLSLATIFSAEGRSSTAMKDQFPYISNGYFEQIIMPDMEFGVQDMDFKPTCPNRHEITPCICEYIEIINALNLYCHEIESEEQLKQVFQVHFPFLSFKGFYIKFNENLKVLESNVFGNISFEIINIDYSAIETVEIDAFKSSYETVTRLDFYYNNLTSFPFDDVMKCSNLRQIDISGNYLDPVPLDVFHGLTILENIYVDDINGTLTGNFQNIPKLQYLYAHYNTLPSTIPTNFFKTGSNDSRYIGITNCQIESVDPEAFDIVVDLDIALGSNLLTTLEEATWRPLFEGGVKLSAEENPLDCGCDVAWLFGEDNLLDYVNHLTTCDNGESLHELDPSIFDDC